jgi:hypothetical protein
LAQDRQRDFAKSHNANSSSIDSRRQEVGTALAAGTTVHIVVGYQQ